MSGINFFKSKFVESEVGWTSGGAQSSRNEIARPGPDGD